MALSEAQQITIATILGVSTIDLAYQISWWGTKITPAVETQIATELARWAISGDDFVNIMAKEKNYGVQIDSADTRDDIRKNIAVLLGYDPSQFAGGAGAYLQRS